MIESTFFKKKVLITGNTGFKGSWLSTWLLMMGADVYGYAISIPTNPSIYETLKLDEKIHQHFGDIRKYVLTISQIKEYKAEAQKQNLEWAL